MHRRVIWLATFAATLSWASPVAGQFEYTTDRPDGHAPLGVLADHMHEAGELMFSYRYIQGRMNGLRVGEAEVFPEDVLDAYEFAVTPLDMTTQMHMVGAMYAPSDRLTLVGMVPFVLKSMNHITASGFFFNTQSAGIGDPSLTAMVSLYEESAYRAHVSGRVSVPVGPLDASDVTPASAPGEARLPYPMQLGSGTVDFEPNATALAMNEFGSVGGQLGATFRFGENSEGYRLGDRFRLTGWVARQITDFISVSARLEWQRWGNLTGADPTFGNQVTTQVVPTVFPNLVGGTRLDFPIGVNLYVPEGDLAGHRIALEIVLPLDQDLDGPQLQNDWKVIVGWQKVIN